MEVGFLDLKAQYSAIKDEVGGAIAEVCESQIFALGPVVAKFEDDIACYCGTKCAVGVSSGSDALIISLMALGIGPGDEVITTAFTFFATAGAICRVGAKPVFVDIDAETYNIDAGLIEEKITEKTRAIIPVHLYGQVAAMKEICEIAERHGLAVIEDAAQAIGASQNGKRSGSFGRLGCFSFYPTKNLGGFGDGGLVVTNDEQLYDKLKILRDHGQNPHYYYKEIGGNFRLDAIQAAVLNVKLKYLDQWSGQRQENAALYNKLLKGSAVKTPKVEKGNECIYHQYTIAAKDRDDLQKYLAQNNISSAVFYPHPLHLQECFSQLGCKDDDLPVTEKVCGKVLSLPVYPELRTEQIEYVANKILEFYS